MMQHLAHGVLVLQGTLKHLLPQCTHVSSAFGSGALNSGPCLSYGAQPNPLLAPMFLLDLKVDLSPDCHLTPF